MSTDATTVLTAAARAVDVAVPHEVHIDPTYDGGNEMDVTLDALPAGLYVVNLGDQATLAPYTRGPFPSLGAAITDLYEGATEGQPRLVALLTVSNSCPKEHTMVRLFEGPDTDHVAPEFFRSLSYEPPPWVRTLMAKGAAAESAAHALAGWISGEQFKPVSPDECEDDGPPTWTPVYER